MPRTVLVYRNGKFVERGSAEDTGFSPARGESAYVIQDTMDATWHPADGKVYESKSAFRRSTKSHGCVELGNDEVRDSRPELPPVKDDLLRAWDEVGRRR